MSNPDEIRRDIERTRAELSENINALGDRSNPRNIARSQVDKVKEGATSLKERVFGSPRDPYDDGAVGELGDRVTGAAHDVRDAAGGLVHDARDTVAGVAHDAQDAVTGAVGDARDMVADAPNLVRRRTRGNPLAAGLVAVGIGALLGSLLPSSRREQEAAAQIKEAAEPFTDGVKEMARDMRDHLQPQAEEALGELKEVAQEAMGVVQEEAVHAKETVVEQAKESTEHVRSDAQGAVDETRDDARQVRDDL